MIKVTIQDKEFKLCDEWKDVTFGQYIDVLTIQQNDFEDLEKSIKIISALSDKPSQFEQELYQMDLDDLKELSDKMNWINSGFKDECDKVQPVQYFEIDGKKYTIKKQYNKLTLGEMVSIETVLKSATHNPQEVALAVLIREVDGDGNQKKFSDDFFYYVLNELKYKINLIEVYNYITFFLSGEKIHTKPSKGFLITKI